MRFSRKLLSTGSLVLILLSCGILSAQDQGNENSFLLKLHGKEIGTAKWTQTAIAAKDGGQQIHAQLNFKLPNVAEFDAEESVAYDAQMRFSGATLNTKINGNAQPKMTLVVNADNKKAIFRATLGQDSADLKTVELKPRVVLLNDFDPSGVDVLLQMYKDMHTPMPFQALIIKGSGVSVDGTLRYIGEDKGRLQVGEESRSAPQPLTLKHYLLSSPNVDMDVWSDEKNRLMRAIVRSQQLEYVRGGFVLEQSLPADVAETQVSFHAKDIDLPGTIAAPTTRKPIAVVVMVHGSGPQDRDETVAANRPFRDLALGLAQHGIASFRYDKRTIVAPQTVLAKPTLDTEVNDDAVAAIAFIHAKPELKDVPIFLLGHSLGASMAPFILEKAKTAGLPVKGEIMMAAAARPIDQVIQDQIRTLTPERQRAAALKASKDGFANIRDPKTGDGETAFGNPVGYWRDWLAHDTPAELKKANVPTLLLQAEKDFQVSKQDFDLLNAAGAPANTTAKFFPGLNHLFMPSHTIGMADYDTPSHIPDPVISTIADWIATAARK